MNNSIEKLNYDDDCFLKQATYLIENGKSLFIHIPPNLSGIVDKAINVHEKYFLERLSGKKNYLLLFLLGIYGIRTPHLLAVLNASYLRNYIVTTIKINEELVISLKKR